MTSALKTQNDLRPASDLGFTLTFTTTDPKGVIRTANDVFARVTGFTHDELIGKPHNIVRHPDTPRAIYQMMWEMIPTGQPFSGFIKNQTKDGRTYWVLGNIVKNSDGYASIRLSPSGPLFLAAVSIYADMVAIEKDSGMSEARHFLLEQLGAIGFSSYEDFMTAAVIQEMRLAQEKFKSMNAADEAASLSLFGASRFQSELLIPALKSVRQIEQLFAKVFHLSLLFSEIETDLQEKSVFLSSLAGEIYEQASAFGSTASQNTAEKALAMADSFSNRLGKLNQRTDELLHLMKKAQYEIAISDLQLKMLGVFIEEALSLPSTELASSVGAELKNDLYVLSETTAQHLRIALELVDRLPKAIANFESEVSTLMAHTSDFKRDKSENASDEELRGLLGDLELATLTLEPEIEDLATFKTSLHQALTEASGDTGRIYSLLHEKMTLISKY